MNLINARANGIADKVCDAFGPQDVIVDKKVAGTLVARLD
jgi:hypothetical protein